MCPNGENHWPCRCDFENGDILCENVAPSEIGNILRRTTPIELKAFVMIEWSTAPELNIESHLLVSHTSKRLELYCSKHQKMSNITAIRPQLTIDSDAFSSKRNVTDYLFIFNCDLSRLDFNFLNGFHQLYSLNIHHSANVGMADWGSLPFPHQERKRGSFWKLNL